MTWFKKAFAVLSAILAAVFFFFLRKRQREDEGIRINSEKDKGEALLMSGVIANLERKVAEREKNSKSAVDDYDRFRADHPIVPPDGSDD